MTIDIYLHRASYIAAQVLPFAPEEASRARWVETLRIVKELQVSLLDRSETTSWDDISCTLYTTEPWNYCEQLTTSPTTSIIASNDNGTEDSHTRTVRGAESGALNGAGHGTRDSSQTQPPELISTPGAAIGESIGRSISLKR